MDTVTTYLDTLAQETHRPEAEVMTWVFQAGLRQLWRERALGQYLQHEISRDAAIEAVGIDWVELAERQHQTMLEDVSWGLKQ
jgi:hypothetical protein